MEHEYSSALKNRKSPLRTAIIVAVLAIICFVIYAFSKNIIITIIVAIAFVAMMIQGLQKRPCFVVSDKGVLVKDGDVVKGEYLYKDYQMSSYVAELRVNGVKGGANRYLVLNDGKKETKIITKLSKDMFDEFMANIMSYSLKAANNETAERQTNAN